MKTKKSSDTPVGGSENNMKQRSRPRFCLREFLKPRQNISVRSNENLIASIT